ncbi:Lrp/AsnC family transcriptional regulator [Desulfosediminicola ganghwensis]|uniref:Lrp/AsnC family transcriptional regulator n=1 Tax=Desulfosediminicola ganghwensis TaxID=2569540 RepID=UPI0010ACFC18|nr:Lrp/AsnC ligand binding domain-containing protein [Desulfosediminicola ganghwensis]
MVTAIILIKAKRTGISDVAQKMVNISGVSEVYSVSGSYDLVAIIRVKTNDDLAVLVTDQMRSIEGIENTETMLAFKAFSQHDLDAMFSVGM